MIISRREFVLSQQGLEVVASTESDGLHGVQIRRGHQSIARGVVDIVADTGDVHLTFAPEPNMRNRPSQAAVDALVYLAATISSPQRPDMQPKNLHVDIDMAAGDTAVRALFEKAGCSFPPVNGPRWREAEVACVPASDIHERLGGQFPPEFTMAGMDAPMGPPTLAAKS